MASKPYMQTRSVTTIWTSHQKNQSVGKVSPNSNTATEQRKTRCKKGEKFAVQYPPNRGATLNSPRPDNQPGRSPLMSQRIAWGASAIATKMLTASAMSKANRKSVLNCFRPNAYAANTSGTQNGDTIAIIQSKSSAASMPPILPAAVCAPPEFGLLSPITAPYSPSYPPAKSPRHDRFLIWAGVSRLATSGTFSGRPDIVLPNQFPKSVPNWPEFLAGFGTDRNYP
jgi:hypothetical protein